MDTCNTEVRRRRPLRPPDYDYTRPGAYFITICAHRRECLFGQVIGDQMQVNTFGQAVQACWAELPQHFPHIELDAFVLMPNHVHGIIPTHTIGAQHAAPLPRAKPSGDVLLAGLRSEKLHPLWAIPTPWASGHSIFPERRHHPSSLEPPRRAG